MNPKLRVIITGSSAAISHVLRTVVDNMTGISQTVAVCDIKAIDETVRKYSFDCVIMNDIVAGGTFTLPYCLKNVPVILVTSNETIIQNPKRYGLIGALRASKAGYEAMKAFSDQICEFMKPVLKASASKNGGTYVEERRPEPPPQPQRAPEPPPRPRAKIELIAIGASTGGTDAIIEVVKNLPASTPPVVIVQHMPEGFTKMYSERLDRICKMSVKEAEDGDRLRTGLIIIARGSRQMEVKRDSSGYFITSKPGEKVSGHCPSVDVLFRSVAKIAGKEALGVILTGMGRDGAYGLGDMRRRGSFTIGQDEPSCVVYGMPCVAYQEGAVERQAPLKEIGNILISMTR